MLSNININRTFVDFSMLIANMVFIFADNKLIIFSIL